MVASAKFRIGTIPTLPVRTFTVDEYHKLIDAGILKSGDPYELINGWIVPKMTINPPHNSAVRRLSRRLNRLLNDEWVVQIQGAITLAPDNEPEPDVVVAVGPEERFDDVNPTGKDIALIVEVADSSLEEDRGQKSLIYARARIPIYWIVNLIDRQVEVYSLIRAARNLAYGVPKIYKPGDTLPVILNRRQVADLPVDQILP